MSFHLKIGAMLVVALRVSQ